MAAAGRTMTMPPEPPKTSSRARVATPAPASSPAPMPREQRDAVAVEVMGGGSSGLRRHANPSPGVQIAEDGREYDEPADWLEAQLKVGRARLVCPGCVDTRTGEGTAPSAREAPQHYTASHGHRGGTQ